MFCSKCGKENDNNATVCDGCGFKLTPLSEQENTQPTIDNTAPIAENGENQQTSPATNAADIVTPTTMPELQQPTIEAKKKINPVTIIIAAAVAALAIIVTVVTIITVNVIIPNKNLKNARELAEQGKYKEAIVLFEKYAKDESDLELYNNAIKDQVNAMLDEGKYVEAKEFLDKLEKTDLIRDTINAELDRVKYESLALYCAKQDREVLKSPSSFELNSIEFYESTEGYEPAVSNVSGRNGFGGVATHYSYFGSKALARLGSVSSNDFDDPDDYSDYLTVELIKSCWKKAPVYDKVNVARITKILNEGIDYNIDISQYKNPNTDSDDDDKSL